MKHMRCPSGPRKGDKMKKQIIDMNKAELAEMYIDKIGYNPFEDDPTISTETVRDTLTDWFVEDIGIWGAIKMHPFEFSAPEIVGACNTDNVEEMTLEMARVIIHEYNIEEEIDGLDADVYFPVKKAYNLFYA